MTWPCKVWGTPCPANDANCVCRDSKDEARIVPPSSFGTVRLPGSFTPDLAQDYPR